MTLRRVSHGEHHFKIVDEETFPDEDRVTSNLEDNEIPIDFLRVKDCPLNLSCIYRITPMRFNFRLRNMIVPSVCKKMLPNPFVTEDGRLDTRKLLCGEDEAYHQVRLMKPSGICGNKQIQDIYIPVENPPAKSNPHAVFISEIDYHRGIETAKEEAWDRMFEEELERRAKLKHS